MNSSTKKWFGFNANADAYLLVLTDSPLILKKAQGVSAEFKLALVSSEEPIVLPKKSDILWSRCLNRMAHVGLDKVDPPNQLEKNVQQKGGSFHSLESFVCLFSGGYECLSDFWGINTHYWFQDKDSFICSNNILFVARVIEASLSLDGIYEALFFNAPLSCTWFDRVNCLNAGEKLTYTRGSHMVKVSTSPVQDRLNNLPEVSLVESANEFFEKVKHTFSGRDCYLCLSAGSDTRTILACMRNKHIRVKAVSFGSDTYKETVLIKKLVQRYKVPWSLVNLNGFENDWVRLVTRSIVEGNGLLNASRLHYFRLYDFLPSGSPTFEGILGSELVKGEISFGAIITDSHRAVIVEGMSIEKALKKNYPEVPEDFCKSAALYLTEKFSGTLRHIETEDGRRDFVQYALEYIPSKMFSGLVHVAQTHHEMYYPFLSPLIISAIFRSGYGVANSVNLRKDFDPYRSIIAQSKIVQFMDKELYRTLLDRRMTFEEAEKGNNIVFKVKRKYRGAVDLIKYSGYYKRDQVDNSLLNTLKRKELETSGPHDSIFPVKISNESNFRLIDLLLNLQFLKDAVKVPFGSLGS